MSEETTNNPEGEIIDEKTDPSMRGKERMDHIKPRIETLVRTMTGFYDVPITSKLDARSIAAIKKMGQDPEKTWFMKFKRDSETGEEIPEPELVHIPGIIQERSEQIALAKAAHEAGHVIGTRFGVIPEDMMGELGFSGMMIALEERPTDQIARERAPGLAESIDVMRRDLVIDMLESLQARIDGREGVEEEASIDHPVLGGSAANTDVEARTYDTKAIGELLKGRTSRYKEFTQLCVFEPHHSKEELEAFFDPDVLRVYESVRSNIELVEHTVPAEGADEEDTEDAQFYRAAVTYKKILPNIQELIQADLADERAHALAQEEVRKRMREEGMRDRDINGIEDTLAEREQLEMDRTELKSQRVKLMFDDDLDEDDRKVAVDAINKQIEETEKAITEVQKELEAQLPEWLKELLKMMAKMYMQAIEDKIVVEHGGNTSPEKMKTHAQRADDKKHEAKRKQEEEKRKKEEDDRRKKEEEAKKIREEAEKKHQELEQNKSLYEKEYDQINEHFEELYGELDDILNPTIASQITEHATGTTPNLKRVFLWEGQKGGGATELTVKPFDVVTKPEKKDYAITILVDLSGSMGEGADEYLWHDQRELKDIEKAYVGSRIHETFKAVILVVEVLDALGIRNNVVGLQDKAFVLKDFNEPLTDEVRRKISGMVYEVYNANPGGNNKSEGNDDGKCIKEASVMLEEEMAEHKIMAVMSDGQPAPHNTPRDSEGNIISGKEHLKQTVIEIIQTTNQKLIGFGIGQGTDHVTQYYPASEPNVDISNVVKKAASLLRTVITQPHILEQATQLMKKKLEDANAHTRR